MGSDSTRRGGLLVTVLTTAALLGGAGCVEVPDEPDDPEDQAFGGPKADGFCVDEASDAAAGVLALVNDRRISFALLDDPVGAGGAGLSRRAADGIVAARPFASLAELDAVPFVGVATCRALRDFACGPRRLCQPAVEVMTWNLEQFPLTAETVPLVVEVLRQRGTEVIALQEVRDPAALASLAAELGVHEVHLGRGDGFTAVAVLVLTDRLRVEAVERLFPDRRDAFPRTPVQVDLVLEVDGGAIPLTVIAVHLKAQEDATSHARRREAIAALHALVEQRAAAGHGAALVVGDFNDRLLDVGDGNVFGAFLDQPDRFEFLTMPLAEAGEFSFVPFRTLIDHVVATTATFDALVPRSTAIVGLDQQIDRYLRRVSDHLPIAARFGPRPAVD
jgi:endonuclease/exonuclease/phosphatase family metal-dependent hydrolase